jgi:undecaprenyl-phosphate 4-deoxy-4-formamido-L-arabinose transferase
MISVVMPTFNRSNNLEHVVKTVYDYLKSRFATFEIIVVDDGSRDDTSYVLKQLSEDYLEVKGIVLSKNVGQQMATLAGLRYAQYPYGITLDDDLEYDVTAIEKIVQGLDAGHDVVYVENLQLRNATYRQWGTRIKEWVFFAFLNKPKYIHLTSYRGMNRYVLDHVIADTHPVVYISARILQIPVNIVMVSSDHSVPHQVKSNYNLFKLTKVLIQTLYQYRLRPNHGRHAKQALQYEIKEVYP